MKITMLTIAISYSMAAIAQSDEYIVKHNGDTVRGVVEILSKQINVINAPGDTVTFNSGEVRTFVNKKSVKTVLRLVLRGYSDKIEEVKSPTYRNPVYDTTLLLKTLISGGKLSLYTAKDKRNVVYFFVQRPTDSLPIQLLYSVDGNMPEKDSYGKLYTYVNYVTYRRTFVDQLYMMTEACAYTTEAYLNALDYRESSIKTFIKRYNKKCL